MDPGGPLDLAAHAAIADRRGRLLVLHRPGTSDENPDRWEFPGGPLAPGEGVAHALALRVRAATGLDVRAGRLLGAGDQERREGRVVHLVLGVDAPSSQEIVLSGEHDAHRWVTPRGLAGLPLSDWMEGWYRAQQE